MVRPLASFSLVSMLALAGCFSSPAAVEGRPCGDSDPCPANFICSEGGCTYSPGAPGPATTAATTTHTSTTVATSNGSTRGTSNTATTSGTHSTGTNSGTTHTATTSGTGTHTSTSTGTNTSTGTTGTGTNSTGTVTTPITFSTSSSGGINPVCAPCFNSHQCASGYCNFNGSPMGGYCDVPGCGSNPTQCGPFGCSGFGCGCFQSNTSTSIGTTSSTSTSGTTGGFLPVCAFCNQDSECVSGYCDPSQGVCQALSDCTQNPSVCGFYPCDPNTGSCACVHGGSSGFTGTSGTTGGTCDPAGVYVGLGKGFLCCSGVTDPSGFCAGFSTSSTAGSSSSGGSSGTTGSCIGPGIQSDANCGGAHQVCGSGETCQQFTPLFGSSFYGCACKTASGTIADSCRAANDTPNGNGRVVCDSSTLNCRFAQDLEAPDQYGGADGGAPQCAPGYDSLPTNLWWDGGPPPTCAQPCNINSDCTADFTICAPSGGSGNHCTYNLCGPDVNPNGRVQYYGPCNSVGIGDGTCQPFPNSMNGYYGMCFRNGNINSTGACGALLGQASSACVAGDLCIPLGQPVDPCQGLQNTACLPSCNANSGVAGPTTPPCPNFFGQQTSCQTITGDPVGTDLEAGICY